MLDLVLLIDLRRDLRQAIEERLQVRQCSCLLAEKTSQVSRKLAVLLDPMDMVVNEIDHVLELGFDLLFFADFFSLLKKRLDRFGAATRAGSADALAVSPLMRAPLPAGYIEDR